MPMAVWINMREEEAARRLFGLLPEDQAAEMMELWAEFERRESAESRYANAIDRLLPVFHNYASQEAPGWRTGYHAARF